MLALTSFEVYYALFLAIIITFTGVLSGIKSNNLHGIKKAALLSTAIVAGILINLEPNLVGHFRNGPNAEVARRSPVDSDIFGLKMMQLIMPHLELNRSGFLRNLFAFN
jgi:phosphoglycerol transferase